MTFSVYTNKGTKRKTNEDSYLIKEGECSVVITVADGMGGHRAGDIASKLAVEYIDEYNFDFSGDLKEDLKEAIIGANDYIIKQGEKNEEYRGMGTTLSIGVIYKNMLYIGHIGDSRIYLYHNRELQQLTSDHSLVNSLLEKGRISKNEAEDHPRKHILTQALGIEEDLEIEINDLPLTQGDHLLFCTDGLTDMLNFEEIREIMEENQGEVDLISRLLGERAMESGGNDNITLVTGII